MNLRRSWKEAGKNLKGSECNQKMYRSDECERVILCLDSKLNLQPNSRRPHQLKAKILLSSLTDCSPGAWRAKCDMKYVIHINCSLNADH